MFFRKKDRPEDRAEKAREIAVKMLGQQARVEVEACFPTAQRYPFLAEVGQNALCGYLVEGSWRGRALSLALPLQLYHSQRDRSLRHYALTGLCLQLADPAWSRETACLFSGRPFRPPVGAGWVENPLILRRPLWSAGQTLSPAGRERAERLTLWLENQAAAAISARYGLFLGNGAATVVFWEPELYDLEGQLGVLTQLLEELAGTGY